jgi:hypothetical protein
MMSLDHPYGLVGRCECCSSMGILFGSQYVAQVEENTKRRTPAAAKVSASARPCSTLFSKYSSGCVTDSPTYQRGKVNARLNFMFSTDRPATVVGLRLDPVRC